MAKGKQDAKGKEDPKKKANLLAKAKNAAGKAKKKKWSKSKVKEKLNNAVYLTTENYNKLLKEIPKNKLITPSVISDRLKVNVSIARQAIKELEAKELIKRVGEHHHAQDIFTRHVPS